jgi:hypothetical protein
MSAQQATHYGIQQACSKGRVYLGIWIEDMALQLRSQLRSQLHALLITADMDETNN